MKEAKHYTKLQNSKVKCQLCPHKCRLSEGATGICNSRKNIGGKLYAMNYGKVAVISHDPIEKKPIYHFHPGTQTLSIGTTGCNFRCKFCQNWKVAQSPYKTIDVTSEQIVNTALKEGSMGIAYTFTESLMWYEFVLDTAKLAHSKGLKNILVTNGYVELEPLEELLDYIDAANVDLKGFTDKFYKGFCGGRLEPVKKAIEVFNKKCHLELTTLLIPGENDSPEEIEEMVDWIAGVNPEIPLHLARYYPNYKLDLPQTPIETMNEAYEIASKKLKYVHINNTEEG